MPGGVSRTESRDVSAPTARTVEDVILWLRRELEAVGSSPHTVRQYLSTSRRFLEVAGTDLPRIPHERIAAWLSSSSRDPATLRANANALRRLFLLAGRDDYRSLVPRARAPNRVPKYLAWDDVEKMLAAARSNPRDLALLAVLSCCALRIGEAMNLRPEDVDLSSLVLHVLSGKGNRDRDLPISRETADLLRPWLETRPASGSLFDVSKITAQRTVNRIGLAALGKPVHAHMLRHSLATHALSRGVDVRKIQALLGHASLASTQIYTHVDMASLRKDVEEKLR